MNDDMNLLLNKNKTEKKKKYKNDEKNKQLEFLLVRNKYTDKHNNLENALKELNKIHVLDRNIHEIKNEILIDYSGEFQMVGSLKVGDQIRQTRSRFRNIAEYEAYIISIDQDYDSEDAIFNGYLYKINTPPFDKVNRSQYGNSCDSKHEIIENRGYTCFMQTKGYCFVKCFINITGQDYKQQYFIRNGKSRSNIMTKARIHKFCRANNINLGYFDGESVFPRSVNYRDNALFYTTIIFVQSGKAKILVLNKLFEN